MNEYKSAERGISDALGSVILISIVALGISLLFISILSSPAPHKIPALDAVLFNTSNTIYLRHDGGDTLSRDEMVILVDSIDQTSTFTHSSGSDAWQSWAVGDTLSSTITGGQMPGSVQLIYKSGSFSQLIQWIGIPPVATQRTYPPTVITSPTPVPPLPVVADFSGLPREGSPGLNVQFTDRSSGPVTSWLWNFHDGSITSTEQDPSHRYILPGRYRVTLTVGNGSGSNTKTLDRYITVNPDPAWYDCTWGYRKNITIQKSRVSGTLTNFPVLINFVSDSDLRDHARSDGHDILFTDSSGTAVIPHEISQYTSTTGALVAWVNIPTVSSAENTTIYLYYGNPASSDKQNKNGVWDSQYRTVWHLDEGGTGTRYDSTSNANNAIPRYYAGTEGTTGQIAGADRLHRYPTDYLESTRNIGITGNAARTISFWVNLDDTNRNGMVGWGANVDRGEFEAAVRDNRYFLWGYGSGRDWDTAMTPATGSWHYHTITYDPTTTPRSRWYVDGSLIRSTSDYTYNTADSTVSIGYEYDGGRSTIEKTSYLKGVIDEVRISTVARSADWIATENRNQASPSTFAIRGSEVIWWC